MSVWFDCDSCWDGFLDSAPASVELSELVPASPDAVFASILDPVQHAAWSPGVLEARWLSSPPPGVGSERRVIHATLRVDQRVAALEPARRVAFYAVRSSSPGLSQLMEEFLLDEERWGTRVRWRLGWRLRLPLRMLEPATVALAGRALRPTLAGLREYFDTRGQVRSGPSSAPRRVPYPADGSVDAYVRRKAVGEPSSSENEDASSEPQVPGFGASRRVSSVGSVVRLGLAPGRDELEVRVDPVTTR